KFATESKKYLGERFDAYGDFFNRVHPRFRKAIKILISVVVGALLLAGLYTLFKDTILPTLQSKIQNLFNYNG
ncbi:DUF6133 family protein, partial [Hungatella sp.]|uniref:DUF6133 family protein n=1 Tax=Hungatella sp. TaxID=2613924 RepID=UPI002A7FEFBB